MSTCPRCNLDDKLRAVPRCTRPDCPAWTEKTAKLDYQFKGGWEERPPARDDNQFATDPRPRIFPSGMFCWTCLVVLIVAAVAMVSLTRGWW